MDDLTRRGLMTAGFALPVAGLLAAVPATEAHAAAPRFDEARLKSELRKIIGSKSIGVAVRDRRSGRIIEVNGSMQCEMASTVKLSTSIVLARWVAARKRSLNSTEKTWVTNALRVSANDPQSSMWARVGKWPAFNSFARSIGLSSRTVANTGRGWGATFTTALDQMKLIDALIDNRIPGMYSADRTHIFNGINRSTPIWGVGAPGRSGRAVLVKNGWVPIGGVWRVNSVGWLRDSRHNYSMAIYSKTFRSYEAGQKTLNQIGNTVFNRLAY